METLCQHSPLNKDTNIQTNPVVLDNLDSKRRTTPPWRMNLQMLDNNKAVEEISSLITDIKAVYEWDDFKAKVKQTFQEIGIKTEKRKRDSIRNLTNRLHRLRQKDYTPEVTKDINIVSTKLAKLELDLADRLAIQSGTRWLEQGERSSSYFFSRFSQRLQLAKIPDIEVNGTKITDPQGKAVACKEHLQKQWERRE